MSNKSISCYRIFHRAATAGGRPTTATKLKEQVECSTINPNAMDSQCAPG
jgi:hypothetical protein